jgi:hypothetical protein
MGSIRKAAFRSRLDAIAVARIARMLKNGTTIGGQEMDRDQTPQSPPLSKALLLMSEALAILDEDEVPGEIGAHLDLAIARLESELGIEPGPQSSLEALAAAIGF